MFTTKPQNEKNHSIPFILSLNICTALLNIHTVLKKHTCGTEGIHRNCNTSVLVTSGVGDANLIREGVLVSYATANKLP